MAAATSQPPTKIFKGIVRVRYILPGIKTLAGRGYQTYPEIETKRTVTQKGRDQYFVSASKVKKVLDGDEDIRNHFSKTGEFYIKQSSPTGEMKQLCFFDSRTDEMPVTSVPLCKNGGLPVFQVLVQLGNHPPSPSIVHYNAEIRTTVKVIAAGQKDGLRSQSQTFKDVMVQIESNGGKEIARVNVHHLYNEMKKQSYCFVLDHKKIESRTVVVHREQSTEGFFVELPVKINQNLDKMIKNKTGGSVAVATRATHTAADLGLIPDVEPDVEAAEERVAKARRAKRAKAKGQKRKDAKTAAVSDDDKDDDDIPIVQTVMKRLKRCADVDVAAAAAVADPQAPEATPVVVPPVPVALAATTAATLVSEPVISAPAAGATAPLQAPVMARTTAEQKEAARTAALTAAAATGLAALVAAAQDEFVSEKFLEEEIQLHLKKLAGLQAELAQLRANNRTREKLLNNFHSINSELTQLCDEARYTALVAGESAAAAAAHE